MDRITFAGKFGKYDYIAVDRESGVIVETGLGTQRGSDVTFGPDTVLAAGDFNAHSHPEQSMYVEIVDPSWELARWCRETIYKYSALMTPERIYYSCVRAFSRMLAFGETSVMVSFYCHNGRGNELDRAVIKAARDVGIRLFFGRMDYDVITEGAYKEKQDSQRSYFETPDTAERNFNKLFNEENSMLRVSPALHSFHADTEEAIVRGINLADGFHCKVQLHLSEDAGDVKLSMETYGKRPVEVLESFYEQGRVHTLSHVVLSDCVWTDDHEKELIKELGMSVVINGRMNDRVKAGRSDVKKYLDMGIPLYVGTDGEASNDDLSIEHEREWLVKTHGLDAAHAAMLVRPFEERGMRVGELEKGAEADFKVLKDGRLDALYVGGREVMADGKLKASELADEAEKFIKDLWKK